MATIEELTNLFAEEHRKTEEERRKTEEAFQKLLETHARFSTELLQFKEENRIGFAELHEIQRRNEEENRIGFEELRKSLRKTDRNFNTQWCRLVEALVNNQVIPLLQSRNIPVTETSQNIKGCFQGRNYEFDIIAKNGDTIVVIEVKTTLRVEDIHEFLDKLAHFKNWRHEYSDMKVVAAVAFLREEGGAAVLAEKKGLFTILATGSSARITNPPEFQPREF